jgi:hypothetical protein
VQILIDPKTGMPNLATGSRALVWMLLVGVIHHTTGDVAEKPESERVAPLQGEPIQKGFVIVKGQYLLPPYAIARRGDDLLVNDHLIATGTVPGAHRGHGLRGPGGRRRFLQFKKRLNGNALLIVLDDGTAGFLVGADAALILEILLSGAPSKTKVQALNGEEVGWIEPAQWARIVETFEPTPELIERVRPLAEKHRAIVEASIASHERLMSGAVFRSKSIRYAATIAAMMLAAIAVGTLLNHRPNTNARWRDVDHAGDGVPMVVRNVVLLVLLGLFDLVLTLAAQEAGGFLELNPLSSQVGHNPVLLAALKTTSLLIACSILVMLRRYRGAQVASWWLCLVCTILAFRWLTYSSMFLI